MSDNGTKRFQLVFFTTTFVLAISAALAATWTKVHPIVDAQSGYLLGGSKNGKWIGDKATAVALKGGGTYRVYSLSKAFGQRHWRRAGPQ